MLVCEVVSSMVSAVQSLVNSNHFDMRPAGVRHGGTHAFKSGGEMLHKNKREAELLQQSGQKTLEGIKAAGRGADAEDVEKGRERVFRGGVFHRISNLSIY